MVYVIGHILIIIGLATLASVGLEGLNHYGNTHPPKSLIREVDHYERLYIQQHGSLPIDFPQRPKTRDELNRRLETLKYLTNLQKNN